MSEVIITGPGLYRTVDGRRVEVIIASDDRFATATNLTAMDYSNPAIRSISTPQTYLRNGKVSRIRTGEENDRIVGPWIEPPTMISGPGEYVTRDGRKATVNPGGYGGGTSARYHTGDEGDSYAVFAETGRCNSTKETLCDIVGPWVEPVPVTTSPVQDVTTKRVVPGVYGLVGVSRANVTPDRFNVWIPTTTATPAQLRDAARILTELADFIDA